MSITWLKNYWTGMERMVEHDIDLSIDKLKKQIKMKLLEKDMKQVELANLINEGQVQVNRAINGDASPKSKTIRKKIYLILGME